jgi:hypothetical protein
VTEADVVAYRLERPEDLAALEDRLAHSMERLHDNDVYRSVGLYVALLLQDIDLMKTSDGMLARGTSGEVGQRLAAVVRQGISARDNKRAGAVPMWAVIVMVVLGVVLLSVIVFAVTCSALVLSSGTDA